MNFAVVTSCSGAGWKQYGSRFVETFLQFWPEGIELILCSEDDLGEAARKHAYAPNFTLLDLRATAGGFIERHASNALTQGRVRATGQQGWSEAKVRAGYNFRYDAARFGLKVFAIAMAAERRRIGRLFWIDADVLTFAPVTRALLEEALPSTFALSCLDRGMDYHSECGFVGYNLDHPQTRPFIEAFRSLYATDAVLKLDQWHDSWVFDYLRRDRRVPTHCIPHASRSNPFANAPLLSSVMDHCKGDRKKNGRTPPSERVIKDRIPYWNAA